jgi:hypothetical protein
MGRIASVALVVWLIAESTVAQPAPTVAAAPPPDGLHAMPSLYWKSGPHRVDVGAAARVRMEGWDTPSLTNGDWDWFTGTRLRLSLRYSHAEKIVLFVEGQDTRLHGLDADSAAPVRGYFTTGGLDSNTHGTSLRQAYLELRPGEGIALRVGRQDIKLGSEVSYAEPNWKYLKAARLGERLVGTVGWTHVERSYDAGTLLVDSGEHAFYAFAGRPTTGVFDADSAYRPQHDLVFGGAAFTAKRGEWLPNTELGAFAIAYDDDREATAGGIAGGVDVYTFGASALGVYPLGAAQVDALGWIAGQTGDYGGNDHGAYAGIFEAGVQLPKVFGKPWLRAGINFASGDSDPSDGEHETFFNLLPTNHLYYGFADQLAFQNLKDLFVQLRLAPHEKLSLNAFVHYFSLMEADDSRYGGTGAFSRTSFGYVASSSNGARTVGVEYDLVATLALHKTLTVELGISHLDAGRVMSGDVELGYASVELRY